MSKYAGRFENTANETFNAQEHAVQIDKIIEQAVSAKSAQALGLQGQAQTTSINNELVSNGRYVIVRSRDAGVQCGNLAGYEGSTVRLTNARQMWQWKAKNGGSLLDCGNFGVEKSGCKFSAPNAEVTIFNACAIIDVTDEARKTYDTVTWA